MPWINQVPSDSAQWKVLILPFPVAMSQKVIGALQSFVRGGGTLISEACPGRLSEYGIGFKEDMAPGVADLFGARHKRVVLIGEPNHGAKWTSVEYSYGDRVEYQDFIGTGGFSGFTVFPA